MAMRRLFLEILLVRPCERYSTMLEETCEDHVAMTLRLHEIGPYFDAFCYELKRKNKVA